MNKYLAKFFRIAKEGETIDGRKITRDQIQQMADNYNAKEKHGARIWLDHFRSYFPDGYFQPQGDVLETKAEEGEDGKLGLYGLLNPLDSLLELNHDGKKVYTSIEMDPDYCGSGEAYLTGLAATDNPSVGGTDYLNWFSARTKDDETKMFSAFLEIDDNFGFEKAEEKPSLFSRISAMFTKTSEDNDARFSDHEQSLELVAKELDDQKAAFTTLKNTVNKIGAGSSGIAFSESEEYKTLTAELDTLKTQIEEYGSQEPHKKRPKSSGEFSNKPKY